MKESVDERVMRNLKEREGKREKDREIEKLNIEVEVGLKTEMISLDGGIGIEVDLVNEKGKRDQGKKEKEAGLEKRVTERGKKKAEVRKREVETGKILMMNTMKGKGLENLGEKEMIQTLGHQSLNANDGRGLGLQKVNMSVQSIRKLVVIPVVHKSLAENIAVEETEMSMTLEAVRSQVTNTDPDQGGQPFSFLLSVNACLPHSSFGHICCADCLPFLH